MEKVVINSYEEFEKLFGSSGLRVSDYVEPSQSRRINLFADAHFGSPVDSRRHRTCQGR